MPSEATSQNKWKRETQPTRAADRQSLCGNALVIGAGMGRGIKGPRFQLRLGIGDTKAGFLAERRTGQGIVSRQRNEMRREKKIPQEQTGINARRIVAYRGQDA